MNNSDECIPQEHVDPSEKDSSRTAFTDFLEQPQFKELHEVSNLLRLMDSMDARARPQYRTYVAGDTTS